MAADALSCFSQRNEDEEEKLQTENTRIFHYLQSLLTSAILSGLSISSSLLPLHQVFICGTHVLLQLRQFWSTFQLELADESPYQASIGSMRLRLQELQETNSEAQGLSLKKAIKKSREYYTTKAYFSCLKLFKPS